MHIIQNNPYRTVGLLVGATAAEQRRQLTRLQRFLEADQEPEDDFSFPTLGKIHRTLESINEAASKLNLDNDKINAALFWFWNGNPITDEVAFDALKEGDLDQVLNLWTQLTNNEDVSQRNASAYSNLSTLYLSGILDGTNTDEAILEQGLSLKLKFLESDFVKDLKALATDETYKTTKKDLQLVFLNQLQSEIERSKKVSLSEFIKILKNQEFTAKTDFLKSFVQKLIEQIEQKIETAKNKRKASKGNAAKAGQDLFTATASDLIQLKGIIDINDIKYSSISDKVAEEIFQCGFDYFKHYKDTTTDPSSASMDLYQKAESLAIGNIVKQYIQKYIENLKQWITETKDNELSDAIVVLRSIRDRYNTNEKKIYAQNLGRISHSELVQIIESSLDWGKEIKLIKEVITPKNVIKIALANNSTQINEYKTLVLFIMSKLSNSYKDEIRYIYFWETSRTTSSSTSRYIPTSSSANTSNKSKKDNSIVIAIIIAIVIIAVFACLEYMIFDTFWVISIVVVIVLLLWP